MEKELYKMLGINEQMLARARKPEDLDLMIAEKLREKIRELYEEMKTTLQMPLREESKLKEDEKFTIFDKVNLIDTKIKDMFEYLFAFMKVMTHQARTDYNSGKLTSVEEDIKNMQENLKRSLKIEYRKNQQSSSMQYNAYQIFGISEDSSATDRAIAEKTLSRINMTSKRKVPQGIEDIADMLFSLQGNMWAYSKLNTSQNRNDYRENIKVTRLAYEAKKSELLIGTVRRQVNQNAISIPLQVSGIGENSARVTHIGRLVNRVFNLDESAINQYALDRTINGEQSRVIFYANIDMARLQSDKSYADFVGNRLLSENTIPLSKRHLGGYIGEFGSRMVEVKAKGEDKGKLIEEFVVGHKLEHIAICKRYQKDKIAEKRKNSNVPPSNPPQGGDPR